MNNVNVVMVREITHISDLTEEIKYFNNYIYGYVIGSVPSKEDLENVKFRKFILKDEFTEEYINDVNFMEDRFAGDFVGVMYLESEVNAPAINDYELTVDENSREIKSWKNVF